MKLDQRISQRFDELEAKIDDVRNTKVFDFQGEEGKKYFSIPYASVAGWATNVSSLFHRTFGETDIHYREFRRVFDAFTQWESEFDNCVSVFRAAKEDYQGGYLFNIVTLTKAEVLSDAIEQAKELLDKGYKDPAAVLGRISLETSLKDLCGRHGITISKLDQMNADLGKAGVYNMAKQKQITAWADLGNKAAHGEWSYYNQDDIAEFISGVERFIADYL